MPVDFIYNGQGFGDVADRLLEADMNHRVLQPWRSQNGRSYVTLEDLGGKERHYFANTPATLTKDAWIKLEEGIIRVARPALRVWSDLVGAGLTYDVPGGMGTTVLQEQTMTEAGSVTMSMDAMKQSDRDRPEFDLRNFPLPIVHGQFSFSARQIAASRQSGARLDTTMAEMVTRRLVEQVESLTIGTAPSYSYGGGTVYGLINKPERLTYTLTNPTANGWTPEVLVDEVLDMITQLQDIQFNGPYGMYFSPAWMKYMNGDYSGTYSGTLRQRMGDIEDISFMRKLAYGFTGFQIVIFQLSQDVIRAVTGMELTALQWDGQGGLAKHFKIMAIMVPQLRVNANEETGIMHGVAP